MRSAPCAAQRCRGVQPKGGHMPATNPRRVPRPWGRDNRLKRLLERRDALGKASAERASHGLPGLGETRISCTTRTPTRAATARSASLRDQPPRRANHMVAGRGTTPLPATSLSTSLFVARAAVGWRVSGADGRCVRHRTRAPRPPRSDCGRCSRGARSRCGTPAGPTCCWVWPGFT